MATNILNTEIIPCGGIVKLTMFSEDTGTWTITRAPTANLSASQVLYEGPPLVSPLQGIYIDIGDGLNGPLDPTTSYTYTFTTTPTGSVTAAVTPGCTMELSYDDFLMLFVAVLKAGVTSLTLPTGGQFKNKPQVFISMPLGGTPPIPSISINEDLLQQEYVPTGHGINTDSTRNLYLIEEIVNRRYRVTVMVSSTQERTFWENAVIALFKSVLIPVLESIGQDISSSFQASSSQVMDPKPGFYFCDIMLEFSGLLPLTITTSYPIVETFEFFTNPGSVLLP